MKDAEFKALRHCIGKNIIASKGSEVMAGYKPDVTVRNGQGRVVHILESEQKTDRKAFLGDMIKAEMYAEKTASNPVLVIVMQEFDNTSVKQIADHLAPYASWLSERSGGSLWIAEFLLITDQDYKLSVYAQESLESEAFRTRARVIYRRGPSDCV